MQIDESKVSKHAYEKTSKSGKLTIRYALKAVDEDGTNLAKFCSKAADDAKFDYSDKTNVAGLLVEVFAARFNLSRLNTLFPFVSVTPFESQTVNLLFTS